MNANWWHVCRTPKALFGTFGHMSNDHSTTIITVHDSTLCSNNKISFFCHTLKQDFHHKCQIRIEWISENPQKYWSLLWTEMWKLHFMGLTITIKV